MPKEVWDEVVGMDAEKAKDVIAGENKSLKVTIHNIDDMVTADFRENRVRIFKDKYGKVAYPPQIG